MSACIDSIVRFSSMTRWDICWRSLHTFATASIRRARKSWFKKQGSAAPRGIVRVQKWIAPGLSCPQCHAWIPVNFVQAWRWHLDTCSNVRYVKTELGRFYKLLHLDVDVNKAPHQNHHLTRRVNTLHEALQHVQRKYTARTMMNLRLSIPKTSRRKRVENGERYIINGVGNNSLRVCFVLVLISTSNSKWHHSTSHYVLMWYFAKWWQWTHRRMQ